VFSALIYMGIRVFSDKTYIADFEAYCPFGGLQAVGSFLTLGSLSCSMTSMQIMMGIMLFAGAVLFSKLFCAYICPIGTISEWIGRLGDKYKLRFTPGETADNSLRSLKYILLFLTFYFTLTSSELFCKKFDPYYAVVSGFSTDVVLLWATISLVVFIVGSFFFRLFWCKYLCPFGALTNIFRFSWWFLGLVVIFIALNLAGLNIPFIYILLVFACAGYMLEILMMKKVNPSLLTITRNTELCTSCNLCSRKCPQGIDVANMKKVDHIDCNLCGDCIYVCPEKDTIQINRKKGVNWLPSFVLALLIALGILMGSIFEFPTIDVKWGTKEQIAEAGLFTKSGLKNIKCFGSSTVFANQMRSVDGIYGVSTFVGTNTVKILYDKTVFNDTTLQKLIFIPEKRVIRDPVESTDSIAVVTLTIDQFFDPLDATYLQYLLLQKTEALGYQSDFACPVIVRIYFPAAKVPDNKTLTGIIESEILNYNDAEVTISAPLRFKVISIEKEPAIISKQTYIDMM
jgi:polyferredoxin